MDKYPPKTEKLNTHITSTCSQSIAPDLLPFLTHLINTSLSTGCFPNSLEEARVNPLLKKATLNPSEDLGVSGSALSLLSSYLNDHAYRKAAQVRVQALVASVSEH
ncbi:unnamed protein product [Pleuronectes platessa]|uniref:Uncharacterized protein n=1 Tax=Pleuronectes platessa TaxID=8262 RepID=A0A9N7Y564_PLEPL|nr:unnamed protein product [Pleuronectes platessa]